MPLATENWSARKFVPGVSASQTFLVSGVADALTAAGICPIAENATFTLDIRLRAGRPDISSPNSPDTFVVTFPFAPSAGSGSGSSGNLNSNPTYHPQIALSTEDVDTDIEGNAIQSSARHPFSRPQKKRFPSVRYVYRRWESSFDGPRAIAFTGTVNSDQFDMPGFGFVQPGQAFCESISVAQAFDRTAQAILVQYAFELRADGFKTRILDSDTQGYSYSGATAKAGPFTSLSGEQITAPIRLDGYGAPYDDNYYKVEGLTAAGLSASPPGAELEQAPLATFLRYSLYKSLPFTGLTLTP
jgi:hypothetical protein